MMNRMALLQALAQFRGGAGMMRGQPGGITPQPMPIEPIPFEGGMGVGGGKLAPQAPLPVVDPQQVDPTGGMGRFARLRMMAARGMGRGQLY